MYAQLCQHTHPPQSNQFIRSTSMIVTIDTASAARRLVWRGSSFKASNEVTTAIAGGVPADLVDALMVALGPCFESLSSKDVNAILELYKATPSAAMTTEAVKVHNAQDSVAEQ